ncbi:MAG: FecR family protein [Gammaproteobacteria bacterium]|nr:FecR family protein [Gammaproteobacteria bacterium]
MMKTKHKLLSSLLLGLVLIVPAQQVLAHAGKVLFASGKVTVKSKRHSNTVLKRGSKVWPGDVVMTGKESSVQIRSGDGSFISLKGNSRLVIAQHKHTGPIEDQRSSIELVKGGMRAVTGLIGKNKPDNFRIKARGSTIGIRGTEFVVQICDKDECNQAKEGEKKEAAKSGVYVGVVNGAITVEKNEKKVELDASLNVVLGVSMGVSKDKFQYVHIDDKPPEKEEEPIVIKEQPKILVKAMAPPAPKLDKDDEKEGKPAKPKHNLKPFEGIDVATLQAHLLATAPVESALSPMEEFEELEYPGKPYVLTPHREIRAGYRGRNIADGQNYDLSGGFPKLDMR